MEQELSTGHRRKTLLLVNPVDSENKGFVKNLSSRHQPLNLGLIAAMTPREWKIKIIDENVRPFKFYPADLVGFTAMTNTSNRIYELAKIYREKGIRTVMGGIHASMCPDEAVNYVDSVVIGEAESVWSKVLDDFENGSLKKVYKGEMTDLIHSPKPRRDLFFPGYYFAAIQTNRGCPMNCHYCSVTAFNGGRYRFRPIDEVIEEMKEIPQKWMMIVDDNIVGHDKFCQERAKELFRAMIHHRINKYYFCQASIDVAEDEEVLRLAAKSGCRLMFIGIESEDTDQLDKINKKVNLKVGVKSYNRIFRKIHKYGIGIIAGSIYGFPTDTFETIDKRVKFFRTCQADAIQSSMMTAFPGTVFHKKMKEENRLAYINFPEDWKHYSFEQLTYHPYTMRREEMEPYALKQIAKVYEAGLIKRRLYRTWWQTRSLSTAYHTYLSYWLYRIAFTGKWEEGKIGWVDKFVRWRKRI
jgi:radical SAM superfamily enzyme YgiQ (UPF0313 family)